MWSIKGFENPHFLSQAVGNVQRDSENGNGTECVIRAKGNPVTPDFQQTPPREYSPREGDNFIFKRWMDGIRYICAFPHQAILLIVFMAEVIIE